MTRSRVARWGSALAVRIPKKVAETACVKEGDWIRFRLSNKRVELRSAEVIPSLDELVAQITPKNRHKEFSFGPDRGREKVTW